MKRCLTDEQLELLARGRAPWLRGFFWRRHLRACVGCRARFDGAQGDERLLAELRQAVSAPDKPSPLSTARGGRRPPQAANRTGEGSGVADAGRQRSGLQP